MKIFVIAGNNAEAEYWIKRDLEKRALSGVTTLSRSEYVTLSNVVQLKGVSNPHGVFYGTWRNRRDIQEIVQSLMMQSTHVNSNLGKVWKEVIPR